MAEIREFRALLYNERFKVDLKNLIAPPYDVISSEFFEKLKNRHPYNAVRLSLAENVNDPSRYKKMRRLFEDWKAEGVLSQPKTAGFYLIEEQFQIDGTQRKRIGFVGLLEVSPFSERKILPHEHTLAGPKKDRLELLKEMGAELSQVFLCYKDQDFILEKIYEHVSQKPAHFDIPEIDLVQRKLWILDSPQDISALKNLIAQRSLLIADGHHRYETSVHFREIEGTEKSKYVQVYMTNLNAPGFSIEPIHRLFSLPPNFTPESFTKALAQDFEITAHPKIDPKLLLGLREREKISFFVKFKAKTENLLCSRAKRGSEDSEVFCLQTEILEKLLGWDLSKATHGILKYEHELADFENTLSKMDRGVGIFLPPTDLDLVMDRAQRGERMPQKSTFFYPKIATGLVNYELGNL